LLHFIVALDVSESRLRVEFDHETSVTIRTSAVQSADCLRIPIIPLAGEIEDEATLCGHKRRIWIPFKSQLYIAQKSRRTVSEERPEPVVQLIREPTQAITIVEFLRGQDAQRDLFCFDELSGISTWRKISVLRTRIELFKVRHEK